MTLVGVVSLGVLLSALLGPWRREAFAPGGLAEPHAQILASQTRNGSCAACHSIAAGRWSDWFGSAGEGHAGVSQSGLCMNCHHTTIHPDRARTAHNLTPDQLRLVAAARSAGLAPVAGVRTANGARGELTWHDSMPRPAFSSQSVECSACHREHGGGGADLTAMSAAQCQTCHQDRFASFAHGHPDWHGWPYGRGGQIAFDHAAHRGDHFPKQGRAFDCRSCHSVSTDGKIARSGTFETSCAGCHDHPLRLQASQGFDLIALPTLDAEPVRRAGISFGQWPESASGIDDLSLAPLTRLLLVSDPGTAAAIDQLTSPAANLWQGPPGPLRLQASADLAAGLRRLVRALGRDLRGETERRLGTPAAARLIGQLSPQLIADADERWFAAGSSLNGEAARDPGQAREAGPPVGQGDQRFPPPSAPADLLTPNDAVDPLALLGSADLLGGSDSLRFGPAEDAPAEIERPFDAVTMLPAGGWYRDDWRLAIRYRGSGHADPVLRGAVELALDSTTTAADRESLLRVPALAACVECHRGAQSGNDSSWRSIRSDAGRRTFTRFSHRPHLNLPALSDCTHCHTIAPAAESGAGEGEPTAARNGNHVATVAMRSAAAAEPAPHPDFAPLPRAACAECHTPQAAGDNCTKCHRYHTDP